jgi:four helix bundle protein
MTFERWLESVPKCIRDDAVWSLEVYRLAVFLSDLVADDCEKRITARKYRVADQLLDCSLSVGANICEGYSRASGKERARFCEIALGSARESRHFVHGSRRILGDRVVEHRLGVLTSIIRLLLATIPAQRERAPYLQDDSPTQHAARSTKPTEDGSTSGEPR